MFKPVLPMKEFQTDAGRRLRRLIRLSRITIREAARVMGIKERLLEAWLVGRSRMNPYAIYRFSRVKNMDCCNYVFMGDWSGLPAPMARILEDEVLQSLEESKSEPHPVAQQGSVGQAHGHALDVVSSKA